MLKCTHILAISILLFGYHTLYGQSSTIPTGVITDPVVCTENPDQTYAVYLPSNYEASRSWPVIYFLDAAARGKYPLTRFKAAAEKHGFIIAGSNNSRNGPLDPIIEAVQSISFDLQNKVSIDPDQIYISGFSGGARAATSIALMSDNIAGVIACGAGFPINVAPGPHISFLYVAAIGTKDMNFLEVSRIIEKMKVLKKPNKTVLFDGGHDWPDTTSCEQIVSWLSPHSDASITADSSDLFNFYLPPPIKTEEEKFQLFYTDNTLLIGKSKFTKDQDIQPVSFWKEVVTKINDMGAPSKSDLEKLLSHRLIDFYWRNSYIAYNDFYVSNDYDQAHMMLDIWEVTQPDLPVPYYHRAKVFAVQGKEKAAVKSLQDAFEKGMKKTVFINNEPVFDYLKGNKSFRELMLRIEREQ